ncbi:MAG: transglutaminase-like domain-containing protein [Polyangiaceae bacterium]|nr:transglutaminase-like domain-containing protein [Polyangiaceae bacterium]
MRHELFQPDAEEDLRLGVTSLGGLLPGAIPTRSGVVQAPVREGSGQAYDQPRGPGQPGDSFGLDRQTMNPGRVSYRDPFRPSLVPYKRLFAFDTLEPSLNWRVSSRELGPVVIGGTAREGEDVFYGEFGVDLAEGQPIRIASVGPGARLRALETSPPHSLEVLRDSADNWFVRSKEGGRVRLLLQTSIDRDVFGSGYLPVTWEALEPFWRAPSVEVIRLGRKVASELGISREQSPQRALLELVEYFRHFQPSDSLASAANPSDLYVELTKTQKGVCRHRAFAFGVTALSLGLPTRVVHNEAHAWVEVFDTLLWHRIDLGGAPAALEEVSDPSIPPYAPPNDPYSWPRSAQPGWQVPGALPPLQIRRRLAKELGRKAERVVSPSQDAEDQLEPGDHFSGVDQDEARPPGSSGSASGVGSLSLGEEIDLRILEERVLRGQTIHLQGSVSLHSQRCPYSRVDLYLESPDGGAPRRSIGSLASNRFGELRGQVTIPADLAVGEFRLTAALGAGCSDAGR